MGRAGRPPRRACARVLGTALALLLGIAFCRREGVEWSRKDFTPLSNAYGSLYFAITGFHIVHVIVGLLVLLALLCSGRCCGYFGPAPPLEVSIGVDVLALRHAVWLAVFATIYLSPRFVAESPSHSRES